MFLINISSNHRQKFFIGTALTQLSELGDMYVSDVFQSSDREGGDKPFYNCCVQLTCSLSLEKCITNTKEIEVKLGRDSSKPNQTPSIMPIDLDVLAHKAKESDTWQFLDKRLPLTEDVVWGLTDLEVDFTHLATNVSNKEMPTPENWWD